MEARRNDDSNAREKGLTVGRKRPCTAERKRAGVSTRLCSGFWRGLGVRRRGDRQRLMNPTHESEPAQVARIRQVITHRARQWADWAAFSRDGMLQETGAEMQDCQSTSVYHSANL